MSDLPRAQWGDEPLPNWREAEADYPDEDPDDELLDETPPDVIEMLGFDPLDFVASEDEDGTPSDTSDGNPSDTRHDGSSAGLRIDMAGETKAPWHDLPRAAGMLIRYKDDDEGEKILFVRNAERGTWEFPGGMVEAGETAEEAAEREVSEEIGSVPYGRSSLLMRDRLTGIDYSTFIARASAMFEPQLSDELTDFMWVSPTTPPEPLHPGVRLALSRLRMNELDLARAIAAGDMSSPQQYENIWLFALRITGTGASYRPELEEHVWRDPGIYLTDEFLARCNGLQVIWEHPPTESLTTSEFEKRTIGAIMLSYLVEDEVWGIAKIYDQDAAQMMLDLPLSTSPAVVFRDPAANQVRKLENGEHLLIEGNPSLLDHLAICELGVWDKGGEPTGVAKGDEEMAQPDLPERKDSIDPFARFTETIERFTAFLG